jgi:putative tryptophan/tyrosine transport system substrate-binding protein
MKRREFIAFLARFYPFPYVVTEGGLISHGVDVADIYRRAAGYADRILSGSKPQDLPVQGPVKFYLAVGRQGRKGAVPHLFGSNT